MGMEIEHRERLLAAGVLAEHLDALPLERADGTWDAWWHEHGNVLYAAPGARLSPGVLHRLFTYPFSRALVVIGSDQPNLVSLLLGDDSTVFVDAACELTAGDVYCGPGSAIVLHGPMIATRCAVLDARNGGSIVTGPDQLWAADVYVATDDMHRLSDAATGRRLNPFGGHIRIGRHVWLCKDAVVTGDVEIGDGAVVGMRSIVRSQDVPARTAVAGAPARVVRQDIEWSEADLP